MPSQLPENILVNLLRRCYLSSSCQCRHMRLRLPARHTARTFSTSTNKRLQLQNEEQGSFQRIVASQDLEDRADSFVLAKSSGKSPISSPAASTQSGPTGPNIAVLGGGITGLSTAYYLSKELPTANITLYEAGDRLGGWLHSKHVDTGNGKVVFEQGPRSIRPHTPSGLVTLELVVLITPIFL
jgi:oxygen-dependent protoporphyrinogen oxidase